MAGGGNFPQVIKDCLDSWKRSLPDYRFEIWDESRASSIDSAWLKESLASRKWAFAADYLRLYAIYKYGGIYLDTDCFVYKSLDVFLGDQAFIGKESAICINGRWETEQHLTCMCFGAEPNNEYIRKCLMFYKGRHFDLCEDKSIPQSLLHGTIMLPFVMKEIATQIGYDSRPSVQRIQHLEYGLTVYPSDYFNAYENNGANCYVKHLALGSWRDENLGRLNKFKTKKTIKDKLLNILFALSWKCGFILIKID